MYIDFAKAFVSVTDPKLLLKLNAYRIGGAILASLKNSLCGQSLKLKVGNTLYSLHSILRMSTESQNSILGPLLFLLFVNNFPENLLNHCMFYADDANICRSIVKSQGS